MATISVVPPNQQSTGTNDQAVSLVDLKDVGDGLSGVPSVPIDKVPAQPVVDSALVQQAEAAAKQAVALEAGQLAAVRAVIPEEPSGEAVSVAINPPVETPNVTLPEAISAQVDQAALAGTLTNETPIDELLTLVRSTFPSTSHPSEAKGASAAAEPLATDRLSALNPDELTSFPAVKVEKTIAKLNEQPDTSVSTPEPEPQSQPADPTESAS